MGSLLLEDSRTERWDTEAYCQEAVFTHAGTGSADSSPKAESRMQQGVALYTQLGFPPHLDSFIPLIRCSIMSEWTVTEAGAHGCRLCYLVVEPHWYTQMLVLHAAFPLFWEGSAPSPLQYSFSVIWGSVSQPWESLQQLLPKIKHPG